MKLLEFVKTIVPWVALNTGMLSARAAKAKDRTTTNIIKPLRIYAPLAIWRQAYSLLWPCAMGIVVDRRVKVVGALNCSFHENECTLTGSCRNFRNVRLSVGSTRRETFPDHHARAGAACSAVCSFAG